MLSIALLSSRKAGSWIARKSLLASSSIVVLTALAFLSTSFAQIVSKAELKVERRGHTATQLPDGRILIVGGQNANGPVSASEIFDLATGTVADGAFLITARTEHSASSPADGTVLIAGGRGDSGPLDSTEI